PLMAGVVTRLSDLSVLTSDNPRTEDPVQILSDVSKGVVAGSRAEVVVDRREAILFAIRQAQPGDVVVIAGKGHEDYQIIGATKYPMDDRELARDALRQVPA
ncbi:MAG: UDP-N-acetylmuramoyl-L-alanyl-D-glutamate--2,6-diaminopimelate ligase, partial [Armatimonadota bacterium]